MKNYPKTLAFIIIFTMGFSINGYSKNCISNSYNDSASGKIIDVNGNSDHIIVGSSDGGKTYKFTVKETPVADYTIDSNIKYQKIYGFGASIAWYERWLVNHPHKNEIYKAIFKNLGITILRLQNWYGKNNNTVDYDSDIVRNADKYLGHPITVLMTSWEMPRNLQTANRATGINRKNGKKRVNVTLKKVNGAYDYAQFADYWLNSLKAYKNVGVVPNYISIQNEPNFWPYGRFMPRQTEKYAGYGKALNAVYTKLQADMTHPPEIVGPETDTINHNVVENYTAAMNLNQISAIAFHLYGPSPTHESTINSFRTIADKYKDMPIFMTEYSNKKEPAIETAVFIHNALVEGNVNAYLFWELVWADGGNGLVALQNPRNPGKWTTKKGYYKREQYYSVQQYSRFIRPGFYRVNINGNSDDVDASAFISPDKQEIVAVLINTNSQPRNIKMNFTNFTYSSSQIYETVYQKGGNRFTDIGSVPGNKIISMPGESVLTVRFIK